MNVEGWQLAGAGMAIVSGSWAIVQRYFSRLESRVDEIDRRQDDLTGVKASLAAHERLDLQQFGDIDRRLISLDTKADLNARAFDSLKSTVIEMRTELRLRNEIRGMVGRRAEDKDSQS